MFLNQFIYIRCHKSFGINLGGGHCFLRRLYLFSLVGGKYEPSRWLSTEVIAFKILQSCLFDPKKDIKKLYLFKSDSDAPYTERQYVKFGRTMDLNKWSIST